MIARQPWMNCCRVLISIIALGLAFLCGAASSVRADAVGYSAIVDLSAKSNQLLAKHHHDWSEASHDARWKMISADKDVFSAQSTYSFLRVSSLSNGKQLFTSPVPALSHIWISEDSRFTFGISKIKLWNPIQVVGFNSRGVRLLAQAV